MNTTEYDAIIMLHDALSTIARIALRAEKKEIGYCIALESIRNYCAIIEKSLTVIGGSEIPAIK